MQFTYNNQTFELIIFTLAGSRFYGTHYDGKGSVDEQGDSREHPFHPEYISDQDFRGVFVADPDTKLGLTGTIDQIEVKKGKDGLIPQEQQDLIKDLNAKLGMDMPLDEDIALYEVKKFIGMALENNPNIMDLLFADDDAIFYSNDKGKKLLENRDVFISKKTKFTFSGYAMSQLKRVRGTVTYGKNTIDILYRALETKDIDDKWIRDNFKGLHEQKIRYLMNV